MGNCALCRKRPKSESTAEEDNEELAGLLQANPHSAPSAHFDIVGEALREEMVRAAERLADDLHHKELKPVVEARGDRTLYQRIKAVFEEQSGTSDLVQNFYGEEVYAYPAKVWLFYLLNRDVDDPLIDLYEVLQSECLSNSLIMLYRARTKGFLVVEPREYVMIRYIRLVGEGKIVDVQQSVDVLGLGDHPLVADALHHAKGSLVKVYAKASIFQARGSSCSAISVVRADMRSSAKLAVLKPFLAASLKKSLPRYSSGIADFYRYRKWADGRQVLWFDSDYDTLVAAFEAADQENDKVTTPIQEHPYASL